MTIPQILQRVRRRKSMTRETLYTYLRRAKVRPISRFRQIPQQYPDDAADRVLATLGFIKRNGKRR